MLKIVNYFKDLNLKDDAQVADFGCGVGENSKILSINLPKGKVFAIDLHKDLLEHLETDIKKESKKVDPTLQNLLPVWGDIEELDGTRLRDESIDAILISNTFHLLQHKKTCILEMKRVLKRGGKILFVDWHKPIGQATYAQKFLLTEKQVEEMFVQADMQVYPILEKDNNHFVLMIQK